MDLFGGQDRDGSLGEFPLPLLGYVTVCSL